MKIVYFIILILVVAPLAGCKDIGLDDEAKDALSCFTGMRCDDDESASHNPNDGKDTDDGDAGHGNDDASESQEDDEDSAPGTGASSSGSGSTTSSGSSNGSTGSSSSSSSSSGTSAGNTGATSGSGGTTVSADPSDSTGGISSLPVTKKGGNRFFMGTYSLTTTYSYPYSSCADVWGNGYEFPAVVRAYSYANAIDFEDNFGNLNWIAEVFPDDTFDFSVQFLDSFGRPSNTVACTCYIEEATSYYYGTEKMKCTCDPSYQLDNVCSLTYDMM